jgi:hypothetical protein
VPKKQDSAPGRKDVIPIYSAGLSPAITIPVRGMKKI